MVRGRRPRSRKAWRVSATCESPLQLDDANPLFKQVLVTPFTGAPVLGADPSLGEKPAVLRCVGNVFVDLVNIQGGTPYVRCCRGIYFGIAVEGVKSVADWLAAPGFQTEEPFADGEYPWIWWKKLMLCTPECFDCPEQGSPTVTAPTALGPVWWNIPFDIRTARRLNPDTCLVFTAQICTEFDQCTQMRIDVAARTLVSM